MGQVLSNWHPLIETPPKDIKDQTDVNEDSSRKKRKSGNDEDKDEIENENQKAVKLQRKHFDIASYLIAKCNFSTLFWFRDLTCCNFSEWTRELEIIICLFVNLMI